MIKGLLTAFLLSTCLILFAQKNEKKCDHDISGQVLELGTDVPIPFATVQIEETGEGTITDEEGHFEIKGICPDEVHVMVSHLAYQSISHHHDAHHASPKIYLAPLAMELEGLVIEDEADKAKIHTSPISGKEVAISDPNKANVGSLIQGLSGASMIQTGPNVAKPMIHGLHSNRVLVINNGVRHSYQAWGREHAPEIDPGAVSNLSIVKGAGTVRYGPEALGGVILLEPDHPSFHQELQGSVVTTLESNGRAGSFETSLDQGYHRLAWEAGVKVRRQGDLSAPDYMLTNTGSNELGYHVQGIWHRPKFDLSVYASRFSQELGILRGSVVGNIQDLAVAMNQEPPEGTDSFSYRINNPRQKIVHDLIKIKGSYFLAGHEFNLQYAFQNNSRKEFDIRRGSNNQRPSIDLDLVTHTLDGEWIYLSETWQGQVGVQAYYQDNNNNPGTNTIPFVPNFNVLNLGAYTIQKREWSRSLFEIGARYDFQTLEARGRDSRNDIYIHSLAFNNATVLVGYSFQLTENLNVSANIASAWRPPNVGELYSFGKHQFNVEYGFWRHEIAGDGISTSNVLDQKSKPVESEKGLKALVSFAYNKEKTKVELVTYANRIKDYFYLRPQGITNTSRGPFPYFVYGQTDALFMGADLDIRIDHTLDLTSEIKMSYVRAQDVRVNQPFLEIPPFNLQYEIEKKLENWNFGFTSEFTARQNHSPIVISPDEILDGRSIGSGYFDFKSPPAAYALIHASAGYEKNKWEINLHCRNMLNTAYRSYTDRLRYFSDNPGRNLMLVAGIKF